MKNSKKILIITIITVIFEIIAGYFFISGINIDKYDNWVSTYANIINSITSLPAMGVKSPVKIDTHVYIEYIESNNNTVCHSELTLKNYDKIFKANQNILIKYNPEKPYEAIYPDYEINLMVKEQIKTMIVFILIILFTICKGIYIYNEEKHCEKYNKIHRNYSNDMLDDLKRINR